LNVKTFENAKNGAILSGAIFSAFFPDKAHLLPTATFMYPVWRGNKVVWKSS
jgi:hypothetical protein